ncbi:hypothetical protein [Rubripirellula reticaptiva]|nr:hypothetical protein [Rubripirellula reticaptiva]
MRAKSVPEKRFHSKGCHRSVSSGKHASVAPIINVEFSLIPKPALAPLVGGRVFEGELALVFGARQVS